MTPSALFAVALSDGDLATTCPGFRDEYQVTPAGDVRINYPPAAPFDPFAVDDADDEPSIHDLRADEADRRYSLDREDWAS